MKKEHEIHIMNLISFLDKQQEICFPKEIYDNICLLRNLSKKYLHSEETSRDVLSEFELYQMLGYAIRLLWKFIPNEGVRYKFSRYHNKHPMKSQHLICKQNRLTMILKYVDFDLSFDGTDAIFFQNYRENIDENAYIEEKICQNCPYANFRMVGSAMVGNLRYQTECSNGFVLHASYRDKVDFSKCIRYKTKKFQNLFFEPYCHYRKIYIEKVRYTYLFIYRFHKTFEHFIQKMSDELYGYFIYFCREKYYTFPNKLQTSALELLSNLLFEEYINFDEKFKLMYYKYAK